jgi:ATP-binding protein involved in chromosome partitioning
VSQPGQIPADASPALTEGAVRSALEAVNDPHVPVSLRRMGMLREIEIAADGTVRVQLCVPCLGCPGLGMLHDRVVEAVSALPGVRRVEIDEGFHLRWTREMVEPEVRQLMRDNGIQI